MRVLFLGGVSERELFPSNVEMAQHCLILVRRYVCGT